MSHVLPTPAEHADGHGREPGAEAFARLRRAAPADAIDAGEKAVRFAAAAQDDAPAGAEQAAEQAEEEQTPQGPTRVRKSPMKGRRRTNVPFLDPSLQKLDKDGHEKSEEQRVKEHEAWTKQVNNAAKELQSCVALRIGTEARSR